MEAETSNRENIFILWFFWQFFEMPKFLLHIWNNYFTFATNIFSMPLLLKTLFSPWRKYKWVYPRGFDIMEFLNTFISNIFSRIIGVFMRIILIVLGILFQVFVAVAGLVIFVCWLFLPFIIFTGFLFVIFF